MTPQSLRRDGDSLLVTWADGAVTRTPWRVLRKECPCAACREDRTKPPDPFRVLSPQEVAAGAPEPVRMAPVGAYAYQIEWNDGHDSGIFTLELLRRLGQPT